MSARPVAAQQIEHDPFVKTHALPENSNDAIDWVCTIATEMAIEHDIAFDSPHHTNKGFNQTPGDANRGRGGGGWCRPSQVLGGIHGSTAWT